MEKFWGEIFNKTYPSIHLLRLCCGSLLISVVWEVGVCSMLRNATCPRIVWFGGVGFFSFTSELLSLPPFSFSVLSDGLTFS